MPTRRFPSDRNITLPLTLIAVILAGAALHTLQSALLPFVVALFLSNIFRPLVRYLQRHHVPMPIAIFLVIVAVGAVFFAVGLVAVTSVQSLIEAIPHYEARWDNSILPALEHALRDAPTEIREQVQELKWNTLVPTSSAMSIVSSGAGSVVSLLSGLVLILLFMLFILASNGMFLRKVNAAYSEEQAKQLTAIVEKVDRKVQKYLLTVSVLNLGGAIITTVILMAFGVDLALLWGLVFFLATFVPTIGSIVAIIIPICVAFLQFDSLTTPVLLTLVLISLQFIWGSGITPKLMGESLNLSPLLVLISLIFWGWVWGPWGMILSVPITSAIKIALENIEGMQTIALLMGAGPVESPPTWRLKRSNKSSSASGTKET
jgi:predicted PurR-regulated permease PerM